MSSSSPRRPLASVGLAAIAVALIATTACDKIEQRLGDLEDQIKANRDCTPGTLACECKEGLCTAGLSCTDVLGYMSCLPLAHCPPGTFGCPCYHDGSCDPDDAGEPQACVEGRCAATGCAAGERDCPCLPGWACLSNADVCDNGMCAADSGQTVKPPAAPVCWSPCTGSDVAAGTLQASCDGEGLLMGCLGDTTCVNGSCLTDEELKLSWEQATACSADAQCPFFQDCIQGHCYSVCETSSDCRMGRACVEKVCRLSCTATGSECSTDEYCQTVDGQSGFCRPLGIKRPLQAPPGVLGSTVAHRAVFVLRAGEVGAGTGLRFSVARPKGTFEVENQGDEPIEVTVSARTMKYWTATEGTKTVSADDGDTPLNWMGAEVWRGEDLVVKKEAGTWTALTLALDGKETLTVQLTGADTAPWGRWEGTYRLLGDDGTEQTLPVAFARVPEGYWSGTMIAFANFGTAGLEEGIAGTVPAAQVGNALVQKWLALKQGDLTLFEFRDILSATANGTWKDPIVQSKCPNEGHALGNHACYPTSIGDGIGHYSFDTETVPVPSGALELPFSMRLRQKPGQSDVKVWQGSVATEDALQYPGNPAVTMTFADDPAVCPGSGTCLSTLKSMAFDAYMGARWESGPGVPCPTGLDPVATPWFVPLFDGGTDTGADGQPLRRSCRSATFPYVADGDPAGWPEAIKSRNRGFSGANPLPTGRSLKRTVRLIDGALIDQDTIFALVKETVPSFLDPTGQETLSTYGYVLLVRTGALEADADFAAQAPPSLASAEPPSPPACDRDLIDEVFPGANFVDPETQMSADQRRRLALAMITGLVPPSQDDELDSSEVHALCVGTDLFDGGPAGIPCPEDSDVRYFVFETATPPALTGTLPCQDGKCQIGEPCSEYRCAEPCASGDASCAVSDDATKCTGCSTSQICRAPCEAGQPCSDANGAGACLAQLNQWGVSGAALVDPVCTCENSATQCDSKALACGSDRVALTDGKTFYATKTEAPLATDPAEASPDDLVAHYLCHETGHIDTGPGASERCPESSQIDWFVLKASVDTSTLACQTAPGVCKAGEACATVLTETGTNTAGAAGVGASLCAVGAACTAKGDCATVVDGWRKAAGNTGFQELTGWKCADPFEVTCRFPADLSVVDLRANKIFYPPQAETVVFRDIRTEIEDAFRYRYMFQNRQGTQVGFAPEACVDGANVIPYCYDAAAIQTIGKRIDCAAHLYDLSYNDLVAGKHFDAILELRSFLEQTFGYTERFEPGLADPVIEPGYEHLFAELIVMMGDESVTNAFASRFDLAGQKIADFPGPSLEPDGLKLGGKPGYELRALYQGIQYYQLALDRFFLHGPLIAESLDDDAVGPPALDGFVGARTAMSYIPRVANASAKKARAWEAVAERYEGLSQIKLAKYVLERASSEAFMESMILLQVMDRIAVTADPSDRAGLLEQKELVQVEYASALRKMRARYEHLTEEQSFYGIPFSFVPIPPMDTLDINIQAVNAFDVALGIANDRLTIALESEKVALAQKREFDTDKEAFKSELAKLQDDMDDEIGEYCGFFTGDDGGIYAAWAANASQSDATRAMGDPCGLVGNGSINDAKLALDGLIEDAKGVQLHIKNLNAKAEDLVAQVSAQCNRVTKLSDVLVSLEGKTTSLSTAKEAMDKTTETLDRVLGFMSDLREGSHCTVVAGTTNGGDCPSKLASTGVWLGVSIPLVAVATATSFVSVGLTDKLGKVEEEKTKVETLTECDAMKIDLQYDLKDLYREMIETQVEANKAGIALEQQLANIRGLTSYVYGSMGDYEQFTQLRIDAEAANNDPNIRIIKNEAIIRADKYFYRAMREAYRATRVFEYYTSQSYAGWEDLKIIRLAGVGERSLQDYLLDLEDAFLEFEYQFGQPDLRLEIVSMRDDIVPVLQKNTAMTEEERRLAFHEALKDVALRDVRGWITLPFSTALKRTSPITANHKVMYVEAELVGRDLGDALGRIYLRQTGTGTIRQLSGDLDQKTFPPETAVINTIFNGKRGTADMQFNPALYKSWRLRDRPLVNTGWELIFNPRDEAVNKDIDLDGLQDIVLYVYYTDFTTLDTVTQ